MAREKKEKAPKVRKPGYIGAGKFWAWESRELSDAGFNFLVGYITFYCTDVMGVSPLIIGALFAGSKVIDAITDLLAGYIVDNTNTKLGKGRPYDFCLIGAWASMVLLFNCPDGWGETAKIVWIVVWYILANAVFYTFLNAGEKVFMLRTFDHDQIVKITSQGSLATSLLGLCCGIIVPQLINNAGTDPYAWSSMTIMLAIPFTIIGMARFAFCREDYDVMAEKKEEKMDMKEVFQLMTKNGYWMLFCMIALISNTVSNMGVTVYYFTKVLGNLGLQSIFAGVSALAVIALVILPKLMKRFSVQQILMGGLLISALCNLICFIFYNNVPILVVCYVLNMAATVPGVYIVNLILYDCALYNEHLGLHRMEGTMGSLNGFMKRCGSALGSLLLGVGLTLIQYDADAVTLAPITFWGLRVMMYGIPLLSAVIQAVLWKFYTLEKQIPAIREELGITE